MRRSSAAKSMLPGNAKFSMTLGIGGQQAYIHRKIGTFMAHRILHLAKTTRGSRDPRARKEIINSLRSRPSAARFARVNCLPIIYLTFTDSCRRSANMNKTGCILHFTMTSSLFRHILQGNKSLQIFPNFTSSSLYVSFLSRAKTNSTSWPAPNVWGEVFVAQLVEHCSAKAGAMGSNPVELPTFLFGSIGNCLNCNYHCNDHVFT